MRNLKRVLSLALALVMVIGMMVMGAGAASADFGDAAEIDYTEAVDVISGLGIMIGDDQGNFNAKDILTREQAAKIICYAMIGAENAEKLGKNTQIFNDVAAGRWSAGYIAYCANLGLLVGYGNGNFGPTDPLTGVQFGKLLLVAAGYNAETQGYTGADWATNIATDMINNGLDIKGVVMSDNLTREQAAQMLLQAMDMNTVTYTTGNVVGMIGPYTTGETFAETYFEDLEKIEGVITANEYADLYADKALPEGKTEIDGKTYKVSTDLTVIGMAVEGWANNGTVLYLALSEDNAVYETGAASDLSAKKFEKTTGLKDNAEYFLNFGGNNGVYTSDYRIEYTLKFSSTADVAAFEKEYNVTLGTGTEFGETFKVGTKISANDLAIIKGIFYSADRNDKAFEIGEVYVGTKSTEDVSDTLSYKQFVAKYIEDDTTYAEITSTNNGDWLKVIDNDGDGKADYVFVTEFAMTEVTNVTKKGVYTLAELHEKPADWMTTTLDPKADDYSFVVAEDVEDGSVVLYTYIDGVYYVELAEMVTNTIDKKGIDKKAGTVTCGDDVYGQSGIDHADIMACDLIAEAETEVSYDFYLDAFGYVRLFTESGWSNGFVLLTDGYYYTNGRTETFQATIFDASAEELADVDVAVGSAKNDNAAETFINTEEGDNGNRGTWGRLESVADVYNFAKCDDTFLTNIAAFSVADDVYTLTGVNSASNKTAYEVVELDNLSNATKLSSKTWTVCNHDDRAADNNTKLQATNDTVYYLVVKNAKGKIAEVITWTGYANAPKTAALANGAVGYAVVENTTLAYDIATVMVFESKAATTTDTYFVYDDSTYTVDAIGYIEADETYGETEVELESRAAVDAMDMINFYDITSDGVAEKITEDGYAEHYIYAAEVRVAQKVSSRDYVVATVNGVDTFSFKPAGTLSYVITQSKNTFGVEEQSDAYKIGQKLIVVTDAKDNILYIINVDLSVDKDDDVLTAAKNLWNAINDAQQPKTPAALNGAINLTVTYGDIEVTAGTNKNLTYAQGKGAKWAVTTADGTKVLDTSGENGYVLTVIAQSEDGTKTKSFTYTVEVADARATTYFGWTESFIKTKKVASLNGNNITVSDTWLAAKGMSLTKFIAEYVEPLDGATAETVANNNGSVSYTVTAENGVTENTYTFTAGTVEVAPPAKH